MVAEHLLINTSKPFGCSLAKISMVAEQGGWWATLLFCCSLAKISMVAEPHHL